MRNRTFSAGTTLLLALPPSVPESGRSGIRREETPESARSAIFPAVLAPWRIPRQLLLLLLQLQLFSLTSVDAVTFSVPLRSGLRLLFEVLMVVGGRAVVGLPDGGVGGVRVGGGELWKIFTSLLTVLNPLMVLLNA